MNRTNIWIVLLAIPAMIVAGCATTPTVQHGQAEALATDDSAAYIDQLYAKPNVSQDEAFAGVMMLLDGDAPAQDFATRVHALADRGLVGPGWTFDPERPLTNGEAAYMIYQAGEFEGGVTLMLTGPSQRYCLREMQYQGLMNDGAFYSEITGMEFAGLLTRAEAYIRTGDVPDVLKR